MRDTLVMFCVEDFPTLCIEDMRVSRTTCIGCHQCHSRLPSIPDDVLWRGVVPYPLLEDMRVCPTVWQQLLLTPDDVLWRRVVPYPPYRGYESLSDCVAASTIDS